MVTIHNTDESDDTVMSVDAIANDSQDSICEIFCSTCNINTYYFLHQT